MLVCSRPSLPVKPLRMRNELSARRPTSRSISLCRADFHPTNLPPPRCSVLTYKNHKNHHWPFKINFSDLNRRIEPRLCYVCKLCFKESLTSEACQPIGHIYVHFVDWEPGLSTVMGDKDVDRRREQLEVKVQSSQRSGIPSGDVTKGFFSDVTWNVWPWMAKIQA